MGGGAEDQDRNDGPKGFAGLSSLVSDVDVIVSEARRNADAIPHAADREAARTNASRPSSPSPKPSPAYQSPPQSGVGGSTGKWIAGIAVVIGLIWLASLSDKRTPSESATYTPALESQSAPGTPPTWQPPSPSVQGSSRPAEESPPAGHALTLTMTQLRYCTAESIRLDAAKVVIDNYSDTDVYRFNALVADYNSRCGQFRYRRGALESARSEVEQYRPEIEAEGRARFARASAPVSSADRLPDVPVAKPDFTVQAIQRMLNKFGYDAGEENGFLGTQTRAAISAFQRDEKITVDGKASTDLLKRLSEHAEVLVQPEVKQASPTISDQRPSSNSRESSAPPNSYISGSNWYCKEGYRKVGDNCDEVKAPPNSFISGSNWYCKEGYRKVGDNCDEVKAPPNSFISGSNWYCKEGYRKVGDNCDEVKAPPNSFISGSNWYCKEGYRKVGDNCDEVKAPPNSFISGSNWYCKEGYRKVGDSCDEVKAPPNSFISGSNWYCKEGYRKVGDRCTPI